MSDENRSLQTGRSSSRAPQAVMLVACLLVCIRLIAGVICSTCILPLELVQSRVVHLHGGGDHEPCDHGKVETGPFAQWACEVTQNETAFALPEIPRLPLILSFFLPLITAHGRGPRVPHS
ncbi:MAG: hypothetical protein ABI988_08270 [Nitrospirota bacterium]